MYDSLMTAVVLLPIIFGFLLLIFNNPIRSGHHERTMEIVTECLVLVNSLMVAALIISTGGRSGNLVLFRLYGQLTVMFKLDLMGSVFAGLVSFLWPLATLYSFEYMKNESRRPMFFAFYTMTYGVTLGVALAGNLITMYLFYEMLTFVTLPLVLYPMTREAARASRQYLYYSIGGAAFAFIGLVFVLSYSAIGTTEFVAGGMLNPELAGQHKNLLLLVYVLAFFGFGVKAAIFPFHDWLPKASVAPTPVTALLHAVAVVKSGAFAVLRFTYFIYGTSFLRGTWAQWAAMTAALVTITFGSTMAVKEIHLKRRLAYSTVSNLSYILFGASIMTPLGLIGALTHLVAHAFMKICAFFCAGAIMHQTEKTYIHQLDGLGRKMPVTFTCFLMSGLSLMGIPLFAGFISKWNLIQAALSWGGDAVAAGIPGGFIPYVGVGVILYSALMTGIYMLTVAIRAFFPAVGAALSSGSAVSAGAVSSSGSTVSAGAVSSSGNAASAGAAQSSGTSVRTEGEEREASDPSWLMLVPLVIFVIMIFVIGLHPEPLLKILEMIGGEAG